MNLELKHLACYLPYGLKIKILNYKCDYVGIEYAVTNGFYLLSGELHVTYDGGSTGKGISDFKPVLRPLSDLKIDFLVDGYEDVTNYLSKNDINKIVTEKMPLYYIPYGQFLRLVSWHFDVFGLIDAGLGIDINNL